MADNVTLNPGSGGAVVATDDDGTAQHQYVKVEFGADNTYTKVTATQGLPVKNGAMTPSWSEAVVIAPQMLAKGAVLTATIDLRNKPEMWLTGGVGRSGATAIDVAISIMAWRTLQQSPIIEALYAPPLSMLCETAASVSGVCAGSGNNAGVASLTLNAAKTFVAGINGGILLCVIDNTTTPTTLSEFLWQSFATSTTVKLLKSVTISAHNSTAHNVTDRASGFAVRLDGGCIWRLVIDYGAATTGDAAFVNAQVTTYDSVVSAAA